MPEEEIKINQIENGDKNVDEELNQLKKEMIGHIVDKMKEKNKDDGVLQFGKDLVVDYLLDEGEAEDKVNDFFLGLSINLFSNSTNQLKDLREKIKNCNTKEDLEFLEKSIIESLDNPGDGQQNSSSYTSGGEVVSGIATTSAVAYTTNIDSYDTTSEIENTVDSAKVGEAREVPLKQRMERLFPEGIPQTEKQMKKYLTKINIPIRTPEGKEKN